MLCFSLQNGWYKLIAQYEERSSSTTLAKMEPSNNPDLIN
jgi:hypothetical protein